MVHSKCSVCYREFGEVRPFAVAPGHDQVIGEPTYQGSECIGSGKLFKVIGRRPLPDRLFPVPSG